MEIESGVSWKPEDSSSRKFSTRKRGEGAENASIPVNPEKERRKGEWNVGMVQVGANCQANGSQPPLERRFTDNQRLHSDGEANQTKPNRSQARRERERDSRLKSTKPNPSRAG